MIIIAQNDIHLRDTRPVNRVDDYYEAQFNKLEQLVGFAKEHNAVLAIGGDLFDTHKVSAEVVNRAIDILSEVPAHRIVACLGQHDVPYHQVNVKKSPVYSLLTSNVLHIEDRRYDEVLFHVGNWETPPSPPKEGYYNVLLGHISVFEDIVPFYWKGEGYTAVELEKQYPGYQLYICGDIHIPFVKGAVVVTGSMMRMSINQRDYAPRCYKIDTVAGTVEPLYFKVAQDVFSVSDIVETNDMDLSNLISAMQDTDRVRQSYRQDCISLAKGNQRAGQLIKEIFDELN